MAGDDETALYGPVKRFLEARGYAVKGEVCGCDLVARHIDDPEDEPPIIVELKLRFTLALLLQGVDRLAISERVYVAVPRPARNARGLSPEAPAIRRLCRRVGLGLIVVGFDRGRDSVSVVEEPVPYRPRVARHRRQRLRAEFDRRAGDPNVGGSRRRPIVTAYRQDALRLVRVLAESSPMPLAKLRDASGVAYAARIAQSNVYGWFVRQGRGVYGLSGSGHEALRIFADAAAALAGPALPERAAA
ncbi:MAG: DUF2161 family putative PD-(D/E)XK-type phosphodiesterase [Alphaproteobacteria bacterium]